MPVVYNLASPQAKALLSAGAKPCGLCLVWGRLATHSWRSPALLVLLGWLK